MTKRRLPSEPATLSTHPRSWKQVAFRGVAAAAMLLGLGGLAVAVPAASPATVAVPAAKGLYVPVTESARAAYLLSMLNNGYELTPFIQLDDLSS